MLRLFAGLVALAALASTPAGACPSGTTADTSLDFYLDCPSGVRVEAYSTSCFDAGHSCVEEYITSGDMRWNCRGCHDCADGEMAGEQFLKRLCDGVPCGNGACAGEDQCCNGTCAPAGATCCGGGFCPGGAACAGSDCCPDNLPVFDGQSGYCCGAAACECGTACATSPGCCPGGAICCDGGWCAQNPSDCPRCPASQPTWCPDGSCAPVGALCCGGGYYCPTGLACADAGDGKWACGDGSYQPAKTAYPTNSSGSVPSRASRAAQQPTLTPTAGRAPTPSKGVSPRNPSFLPGCSCQVGATGGSPWALLALLLLCRRRCRPSRCGR